MAVSAYGKGYRYRFRYTDPNTGEKRWATKGGFALKREAKFAEDDIRRAIYNLKQSPADKTMTVADWLLEFNRGAKVSRDETTSSLYEKIADGWVIPRIGKVRMAQVTKVTIETLEAQLRQGGKRCRHCKGCVARVSGKAKGRVAKYMPCTDPRPLAPTTVQGVHRYLVTAFREAVSRGYLPKSPLEGMRRPHADKVRKTVWTPEQSATFLRHAQYDRNAALWLTVLSTGMRRGELAGLAWDAIDFNSGLAHVHTQRKVTTDYRVLLGNTKTDKSTRMVPLQPMAVEALRRWKDEQAEQYRNLGKAEPPHFVFTGPNGVPVHPQSITRMLNIVQREAGVPVIPLHNLRHTVATLLLGADVHPKVVQELLGHSSIQVTLDLYSQVPQASLRAASSTLSAILSPAPVPPDALPVGVAE